MREENLRASMLMVAAMALFSVEDVLIKRAAGMLPVGQLLVMLGGAGFLVLALLARARGQRVFGPAFVAPPVLFRHLGEILGTLGFVTALALNPISTASALLQSSPLVVTAVAALWLGEKVGWRRWVAIAVGMAGVLVILRPGTDAFRPELLWAVLAVAGLSLRDIATRRVPAEVTTLQLSAWGFLAVVPAGVLAFGLGPAPVAVPAGVLAELGFALAFGLFGYATITQALRLGQISVVAPFRFTRIVFALVLGALVFGERPDAATWAGMALIVGSGLYALWRDARVGRRRGPSPASPAPLYPDPKPPEERSLP